MADKNSQTEPWDNDEESYENDPHTSHTMAFAYFTFDFKAYEKERGHIIDYIRHAPEIADPHFVELLKVNIGRLVDRFISTNCVPKLFHTRDSKQERHLIQFAVEVAYTGTTPMPEEAKAEFLKNPQKFINHEGFQWQIRTGRQIHLNALQLQETLGQKPGLMLGQRSEPSLDE